MGCTTCLGSLSTFAESKVLSYAFCAAPRRQTRP